MSDFHVAVRLLHEHARLPSYARAGDAGADLSVIAPVTLLPGQRALVGTGVAIAIPDGYVGLVHPRSGLAHRHGLSIVNAPGTIDSGYRGEIMLNLVNLDPHEAVTLKVGDRAAQLIIQKVEHATFRSVGELDTTERQSHGHGSTGQ